MNLKVFEVGENELPEGYERTPEEKKIAQFLIKADGNISATAKSLKMSRSGVYKRINKSPFLRMTLNEVREELLDVVESRLFEAARKGEGWAVCFTLKTLGKSRGYTEKSEVNANVKVMTVADLVRQAALQEQEKRKRLEDWDDKDIGEVKTFNDYKND